MYANGCGAEFLPLDREGEEELPVPAVPYEEAARAGLGEHLDALVPRQLGVVPPTTLQLLLVPRQDGDVCDQVQGFHCTAGSCWCCCR